jgi:hypothetical protein
MRKASQRTGSASAVSAVPANHDCTRRRFLLALGAGGAGAAAAAATPALAAPVTAPAAADKAASGYRETAHVRDYYDSARI